MQMSIARICASVLLVALLLVVRPVKGQDVGPLTPDAGTPVPQEVAPQSRTSPDISFIDNPSATCYQPVGGQNECYINWQYIYVTASSPQYMTQMTVTIDSRVRAVYQGFFTTSFYIPGDLHGRGFRVPCGALGAAGNPLLGAAHSYTIRAVETGGLKAANYGSVICPGLRLVYLPMTLRG